MTTTMKRFVILLATALASATAVDAQTVSGVNVDDYTMERNGSFVIVDMNIDISRLEVKGTQAVVLTPRIVRGDRSLDLKPIGIYGRNRYFYYERNEEFSPTQNNEFEFRKRKAPKSIHYNEVVPFEDWMDGCQLVFERKECGCKNSELNKQNGILVSRFPWEPYKPTLIYVRPEAESLKLREISGSAFIDFPVSKTNILTTYRNNKAELAKITGSIDEVKADSDVKITSISIKGFASPESPYDNNTRLAKGRTEALRRYVEKLYHFEENFIATSYEPEDWAGLRKYVEKSNLANKRQILQIIDSKLEPDAKEWKIKSTYKEDYRFLLDNCYPALRHSDYVIQYSVRRYSDVKEIERIMNTAPQKLSLEEFYILAQTYESGSEKLDELWEIAVRMFPNDEIANFNAANSAMDKRDFERAERYLKKAGNRAEVEYSLGCIEILKENYPAALPHLEKADKAGVKEAKAAIDAISNHWKVTKAKKSK